MLDAPRNAQSYPCVPPKVAAAQDYLRFAEQLRNPIPMFDGARPEHRDLNPKEQVVYDAALEVLRTYFAGEMNYEAGGEVIAGGGDEGPTGRVPVTQ